MEKNSRFFYESPTAVAFSVRFEDAVCGSKLRFHHTPDIVAEDIEEDEIIKGGIF